MRFAKPIDKHLLEMAVNKTGVIVTMEEHALRGGFGAACLEIISDLKLPLKYSIRLGFSDIFSPHATRKQLLESVYLTPETAVTHILEEIPQLCKK